jgi:hypothetical protein
VSAHTGAPVEQAMAAPVAHGFVDVQAVPAAHAVQALLVPLHTPATPPDVQAAPAAVKVWSTQTATPLEQSMAAVAAHGLLEVHAAPCVQAPHVPALLHTPTVDPDVHAVPGALNVWTVQTGAPLVQSVVAVAAQTLLDVHAAACVHALHTPVGPLHTPATPPVVQAVPAGWNVSVQTGAPLEHTMEAVASQGLEAQAAPCVHAVHAPLALQTPLPPPATVQEEPTVTNVWSLQTGAPVEQSMVAVAAQALFEVQVAPWVQAVQVDGVGGDVELGLQTPLPPPAGMQGVPAALYVWSVHTGPGEQLMVAVAAHGLVEVQGGPAVQEVHTPALQNPLEPHAVLSARNVRSVQTAAPLEHSMVEVKAQGLDEVQAAPCVQAAQVDGVGGDVELGLQTPVVVPDVHAVPGPLNVWSVQTADPVEQLIVAVAAHGFAEVQAVPAAQAVQAPALQTAPAPHEVPFARSP